VLWEHGITTDFAHPEADLSGYDLVLAPALYLVGDTVAANLRRYVDRGGHLLVSYFSGIVDSNDTVPAGASPGGLRDVLGLEIHEFLPLRAGETTNLSNGNAGAVWAEDIHAATATVVASYLDGPAASGPAITRNAFGGGTAWYVSTKLDGGDLTAVVLDAVRTAGLDAAPKLPEGLEVITRSSSTDKFTFLINHSDTDAQYPARGHDLLTGEPSAPVSVIPGGTVRVLHSQEGVPAT
jgi:beta-galactosidase